MAATNKKSLYEILGVPRDATSIDVGLAYEKRMADLHRATPPDPGLQSLLHEAFEVLSHPDRRAAYDASLVTQSERAAAQEQAAAPDLLLEDAEEAAPARKPPWIAIGAVVAVVAVIAIVMVATKKPEPPKAPPVAEAPAPPPPPPPPKAKSATEVLADSLPSVGRVLSYDMSGSAKPLGLAFAIDPGTMVTTCEGLAANATLVVKRGPESLSATLTITDEALDLCKLSVSGAPLKPLAIAEDPKPADAVYVLGADAKGELAVAQGKVVKSTPGAESAVLEISVPVTAAGSGGAVLDRYGRVVAVASHRLGKGAPAALPASAIATMRSRSRGS